MGLYEQANNRGKTLEMARAELKYDPANPVALLTAARMLVAGTHDSDLDRDARLEEADADARGALQHAGEMTQPASSSARQFADTMAQLRGAAHEVMATVAYKKRDYFSAIREYECRCRREMEHADAWCGFASPWRMTRSANTNWALPTRRRPLRLPGGQSGPSAGRAGEGAPGGTDYRQAGRRSNPEIPRLPARTRESIRTRRCSN